MRRKKVFNMYSDPGHEWMKVPVSLINKLNVKNISQFSYINKDNVFLECDCDMGRFFDAYKVMYGEDSIKDVRFNTYHTNKSSKIRKYEIFYN